MRSEGSRKPLFERLQGTLEEASRFARGELTLRTTDLPAPAPHLKSQDVLELRIQLRMSQHYFARVLNVSAKTVQSWEQGSRNPSQAALRLLQVLHKKPEILSELLDLPTSSQRPAASGNKFK